VAARVPLLVEQANDSAGLLFYRAHGLGLDYPLTFRSISSTTLGAPPSSLPGGLSEGTTYYARPVTPDSFAVATAVSPAAQIASFSGAAVGRFGYMVDPGVALDQAIAKAWNLVQSDCTAHGGDVDAPILTDAAAALAARLYVAALCAGDPAKGASYDGISKLYAEIYAPKLAAYFAGASIRNAVDTTPTVAENGARAICPKEGPFRAPIMPLGGAPSIFGAQLGRTRDRV
jgi:hypothetical protein